MLCDFNAMLAHDKILCSVLCCYSLLLLHITSIRWRRLRPFGLLVLNGFSLWRFASFIFFFFKGVPCGSLVGFMGPLSKCLLLFYPRGDCFLFTPLACMCTRHPDEDINCQNWHHPPLLPLPLVSCPEVHKGLGPSFGSPGRFVRVELQSGSFLGQSVLATQFFDTLLNGHLVLWTAGGFLLLSVFFCRHDDTIIRREK